MTRTTTTKLVATALAVASLGFASTASADNGQGAVTGVKDAQVQTDVPTPGNPAPNIQDQVKDPNVKVVPEDQTEDVDPNSPEYFKSKEAQDRYERYCNIKNGEPSHSDKKFCEDYRRANGTGTGSTSSTGSHGRPDYCKYQNVRYDPDCDHWRPRPHCPGDYVAPHCPKPEPQPYPEPKKPVYHKTEPVYYKKASEPSKGSLPFTGLEIWQLGLIGIVLVGGGIGARRLLVS